MPPLLPGAEHAHARLAAGAWPAGVVLTLDTFAMWRTVATAAPGTPPLLAAYLHGASTWQWARMYGLADDVATWWVPLQGGDWHTLPGWPPRGAVEAMQPGFDPADYRTTKLTPREGLLAVDCSMAKGGMLLVSLVVALRSSGWEGSVRVVSGGGCSAVHQLRDLPGVQVLPQQRDMRALYASARVVVVPSQAETFGRVPLEAVAAGTPVVCRDLPSFRQINRNGALCLVPDGMGLDAWRRWVLARLQDRALWQTCHVAGLALADQWGAAAGDFDPLLRFAERAVLHAVP